MQTPHPFRFPGESDQYRQARDELLRAEIELRTRVREVAALRQKLPLGGEVQDYVFEEGARDLDDRDTVRSVRLSELFEPGKDTLLLYSFMYGPTMADACPMCTSFIDGLNGNGQHLRQRVNLVVAARSPIQRIRDFARGRGWRNLRLVSSAKNTYNRDYYGESPDGSQETMMNVFVRRNGKVHHFYGSETRFVPEPGADPRHVDPMWPLWNALDLTPEGRGQDWYPQLSYGR
jgi:predicted dithiol-disulfide oxidoreductase (DUF899 family)